MGVKITFSDVGELDLCFNISIIKGKYFLDIYTIENSWNEAIRNEVSIPLTLKALDKLHIRLGNFLTSDFRQEKITELLTIEGKEE